MTVRVATAAELAMGPPIDKLYHCSDIFKCIAEHLTIYDVRMLRCASRRLFVANIQVFTLKNDEFVKRHIVIKLMRQFTTAQRLALEACLCGRDVKPTSDVPFRDLVPIYGYCGKYRIVNQCVAAFSLETTWDKKLFCEMAAYNEQSFALIMVDARSVPYASVRYRIKGGHAEALCKMRCVRCMKTAAKYNRKEILVNAQQHITFGVTQYAARGGHLELYIWLRTIAPDDIQETSKIALRYNRINILRYIMQEYNDTLISEEIISEILRNDNIEQFAAFLEYHSLTPLIIVLLLTTSKCLRYLSNCQHLTLRAKTIGWLICNAKLSYLRLTPITQKIEITPIPKYRNYEHQLPLTQHQMQLLRDWNNTGNKIIVRAPVIEDNDNDDDTATCCYICEFAL